MLVGLIEPRDDPECWALAFNSGPDYALQVGVLNGLLTGKGDLKGSGKEHDFLLTLTYF